MSSKWNWPEGKDFAFTVIDDTDHGTVQNLRPVYELLAQLGLWTTKTTWCYSPRDAYTGQSLEDPEYSAFVQELQGKGFELALHNVGSGFFEREEIEEGLELFRKKLGHYPRIHVNHAANPDNIYWGPKRFVPPFSWFYALLDPKRGRAYGEDPDSVHFWGDLHKRRVSYTRNLVFNGINTLKADPRMPYEEPKKRAYANCWFSSSDGHTREEFHDLIHPERVDRLEREGGACIVYTHFASGFLDHEGKVEKGFEERLRYLANKNGWFVPAGTILSHLKERNGTKHVPHSYLFQLNLKWAWNRVLKKIRRGR